MAASGIILNPREPEQGFTLVELMVVVMIVGLLMTAAVIMIRPNDYAKSTRGFAEEIGAQMDVARQRAISTRRYQRIVVDAVGVIHEQSQVEGMMGNESGVAWDEITTIYQPATDIEVASTDSTSHASAGSSVPTLGSGIPAYINFAPDGTADAATVFVHDIADDYRSRVVVYPATASVFVFEEW